MGDLLTGIFGESIVPQQPAQPATKSVPAPAVTPVSEVRRQPAPTVESDRPIDWGHEAEAAFKGSISNALRTAANATGLINRASAILSEKTGLPLNEALTGVRQELDQWANKLSVDPATLANPQDLADKIKLTFVRGVASAPVQVAEIGGLTVVTRSPARAMALIEALREYKPDEAMTWQHAAEIGKGAVRGAITGKAFDIASSIPKLSVNLGANAAISGFQSAIAGGDPHQVIADMLTGATLAVPLRGREKARDVESRPVQMADQAPPPLRPTAQHQYEQVEGVSVRTPQKGMATGSSLISPHLAFRRFERPMEAWRQARDTDIQINADTNRDIATARAAFRSLSVPERKDLILALNDPNITLQSIPQNWAAKKQEAYSVLRSLLEQKRQQIIDTKNVAGDSVPDTWGITEGFFPHQHEGRWAVIARRLDPTTNKYEVVPISHNNQSWLQVTKQDAVKQAKAYNDANPTGPRATVDLMANLVGEIQKAPGERFFGHTQRRDANMPGWVVDESALYHYLRGVNRYSHITKLRPALNEARADLVGAFGESSKEVRLWDSYVDRLEGRQDRTLEEINRRWMVEGKLPFVPFRISRKGGDPDLAQRGLAFAHGAQTLLKLGGSPAAAFNNLSQTLLNTLPVLGPRYTEKGLRGYLSGKYDWLLDRLHVADEEYRSESNFVKQFWTVNKPHDLREVPGATLAAVNHYGMLMFQKAEHANRAIAVIGAYRRAVDQGLSYEKAIQKARDVETRTQFHYGPADAPIILKHPTMKLLTQFRTFMLKQMEFITGFARKNEIGRFDSRGKEFARWLGSALATVGVVGLPGVGLLSWTMQHLLDGAPDFEQEIKKRLPTMAARGTFGDQYGIDVKTMGYGDWPFDPEQDGVITKFTGPVVSDLANLFKIPLAYPGQERDMAKRTFILGLSPHFRRAEKAYGQEFSDAKRALRENPDTPFLERFKDAGTRLLWNVVMAKGEQFGEMRDAKGRRLTDPLSRGQKFFQLLGFRPLSESIERERIGAGMERIKALESLRNEYSNDLMQALMEGDEETYTETLEDAIASGFYPDPRWMTRALRERQQKYGDVVEKRGERIRKPALGPGSAPPPVRSELPVPFPFSGEIR